MMYVVGAVAIGCLLGITGVQAASLPIPRVDYSANRVIESEAGTFTGKVYAAKDKERTEIALRGMESVTIVRRDKRLGWLLMPSHRLYSQLDLARAQQQSGSPADDVSVEEIGLDTVEGHATTKYKLLMKDGSAGGFIWITGEGIAIKMDMLTKEGGKKSRMTMTLTNLKVGPQDAQLFELPRGYNSMPSVGSFGVGR